MNIGDKVVCVDDSPCRCGTSLCQGLMPVERGRVYVVADVYIGVDDRGASWLCLVLVGVPKIANHRLGVNALRFRRLDEIKAQASARLTRFITEELEKV